MSIHDQSGIGAVAIHRWFPNGEGWAYHPWYESRKQELLSVLKPELDNRRQLEAQGGRRRFSYEVREGMLLGEQTSDSQCPDVRAENRYPTILRVVFLPASAPESERGNAVNRLNTMRAEKPGPDYNLSIRVEYETCSTTDGPVNNEASKPSGRARLLAVSALLIGVLFVAGYFHFRPRPAVDDAGVKEVEAKMSDLLQKWQGAPKALGKNGKYEVSERFFRFLSQEPLRGKLQGGHPDVRFVRRLPAAAARPSSPEELRAELENLLASLKHEPASGEKVKKTTTLGSSEELLKQIEQEMDYVGWWKVQGYRTKYAANERIDADVSALTYHFIKSTVNPGQVSAANDILKLLKRWKVDAVTDEDAKKRPWLVFHCFFQFLSQDQFDPKDLRDGESMQVAFVKNLPDSSLIQSEVITDEGQLKTRLKELLGKISTRGGDHVPTLITDIGEYMDYDGWKERAKGVVSRKREEGPPNVKHFVERVRQRQ